MRRKRHKIKIAFVVVIARTFGGGSVGFLRGSESQNAFDRWSSLKGRLSKSVRLRRGCCVGGDALVVLVVFSARFFFVCVRAPLSIEEEK